MRHSPSQRAKDLKYPLRIFERLPGDGYSAIRWKGVKLAKYIPVRDVLTELSSRHRDSDGACEAHNAFQEERRLLPVWRQRAIFTNLCEVAKPVKEQEWERDNRTDEHRVGDDVECMHQLSVRVQDLTRRSSATAGGSEPCHGVKC